MSTLVALRSWLQALWTRVQSLRRLGKSDGVPCEDADAPAPSAPPQPTASPDFALTLLRGLRNRDGCTSAGVVKAAAYTPPTDSREARKRAGREPHGDETSINWEDEPDVLEQTLAEFKHGAIRISTENLARIRSGPHGHYLWWERDPTRKKAYHGNLVYVENPGDDLWHVLALVAAYSERAQ